MLMPTPTALSSGAASKIRQAMPARCSIRPSVSPPMPAPIIKTSMNESPLLRTLVGPLRPRERRFQAPPGDSRQEQRDQNVVPCERNAEETPSGLVASNDPDVLQLLQQITCRAKIIDRPRTVVWARPEFPFHEIGRAHV